jgi:hypothetical protein
VKYLYNENDKTLKKETEDTRKWKDLLCTCINRINIDIMKMATKSNLQIECNLHQNSNVVIHRNRKKL